MSNTILIKRSSTPNAVPSASSLSQGELAINLVDGNLFYKNSSDQVTVIASNKFLTVSGNVQGGNIVTGGRISATGNIAGNYILGNGALLTGIDATSIQNGNSDVRVVSGGGNVSISVGGVADVALFTPTGMTVAGNISAGNISGNGSRLSAITGANVTGQVANALVAGTVYTAAQPNITSVGTLTSLSVTGNITSGNISAARGAFTSVAGTLETAAQPNITSVGTLTSLSSSGNITGANINGAHFGSGAGLSSLTGANVTGQVANALVAGTVYTAAQPNITSVGTLTSLSVTGNITGGNLVTSGAVTGNGRALTSLNATNIDTGTLAQARLANSTLTLGNTTLTLGATTTTVAGLTSVTATTFVGNLTGAATTAGTVTTNAQPNITSVGTLSSLSVTGTVTGGNIATAGTVSAGGNITAGNVSTALISASGNVVGANLVTSGTVFGTNALFTGNLTVDGNVKYINVENLSVQDPIIGLGRGPNNTPLTTNDGLDRGTEMWYYSGSEKAAFMGYQNLSGKLIAASNVTITGDVVTVNEYGTLVVGTLEGTTISASGNVTGGNLRTAGTVSATGTVTGGNVATAGTVSAGGNITGGNISTAGALSAGTLSGNGSAISSLTGANVTGQVGNALVAGTVYTAAQPNITSLGTLSSLSVTGNITGGNLRTAGIGNIATLEITTLANIKATTASTTNTTGALIVAGGVGVAGNVNAGGFYENGAAVLNVNSTVDGGTY